MNAEEAHDVIAMQSGSMGVLDVLSKSLRAMFTAPEGRVLLGGDFSNIEGRIAAWLAGEEWKLEAFRAYDAGTGPDLYKLAYSKTFGVPVDEVTKLQRQKGGKTQELALGYQGSVGAWLRFDPDPTIVTNLVKERYYGAENWRHAADQYDRLKFHNGLSADQWIAVKTVVNGWRDNHPRLTQMWWSVQDAAIQAVDAPGSVVDTIEDRDGARRPLCGGRISYLASDGFLWCRLPSGKLLAYAQPRLVEKRDDWLVDEDGNAHPAGELEEDEIAMRVAAGWELQEGRRRVSVCYFGKNQKTNKWGAQYLYGGSQTNNFVQATARELLRDAMMRLHPEFGDPVLHVHDEVWHEVDEGLADAAKTRYTEIMTALPPWLEGLPLAAQIGCSQRYTK